MKIINRIRREILLQAAKDEPFGLDFDLPLDADDDVELAYDKLVHADAHWDYESEFRYGQCETNIPSESSRHYESKSVARKLADGTWIGWTFWYGGGKWGQPDEIPWMQDAYELTCVEETRTVVMRVFAKVQ